MYQLKATGSNMEIPVMLQKSIYLPISSSDWTTVSTDDFNNSPYLQELINKNLLISQIIPDDDNPVNVMDISDRNTRLLGVVSFPSVQPVSTSKTYQAYGMVSTANFGIATITFSTTTATVTTSAKHGLTTGSTVTISGATPSNYNGTFVITVTSATAFTYTMLTTPTGNATVVGILTLVSYVFPNNMYEFVLMVGTGATVTFTIGSNSWAFASGETFNETIAGSPFTTVTFAATGNFRFYGRG